MKKVLAVVASFVTTARISGVRLCLLFALVGTACGGPPPPDAPGNVTSLASALVDPSDRTHAARAAYYHARAVALRDLAAKKRQLEAVLAARPVRQTPTKSTDLSSTAKADLEARATGLDATATEIQALADFHTAEAAKEVTR